MTGSFDGDAGLIPKELNEKLQKVGRIRHFPPDHHVHSRGDQSTSFLIINRGKVLVSIDDRLGKRVQVTTLTPGQSLGILPLLSGGIRTHDATTTERTEILVVSRAKFDELIAQDAEFRRFILNLLSSRLMQTLELLDDERRLPLLFRVGKQLLRRDDLDTLQGSNQVTLAEELGVSRYAYGKALAVLRDHGLIHTGYRQISISDRSSLHDWITDNASSDARTE